MMSMQGNILGARAIIEIQWESLMNFTVQQKREKYENTHEIKGKACQKVISTENICVQQSCSLNT